MQVSLCPAGWGVVIIARAAGWRCLFLYFLSLHFNLTVVLFLIDDWKILEELYGPVVLDAKSPFSLKATVGTTCWR